MRLNPYISFLDTAREAMTFYQSALGGDLTISTFADMGDTSEMSGRVMHAQLETPEGFTLMASDTPPGLDAKPLQGIGVSLSGDDAEKLRGYFELLSADGEVSMPLERQMWGDVFGMFTDRFGVDWMVNIAGDQSGV